MGYSRIDALPTFDVSVLPVPQGKEPSAPQKRGMVSSEVKVNFPERVQLALLSILAFIISIFRHSDYQLWQLEVLRVIARYGSVDREQYLGTYDGRDFAHALYLQSLIGHAAAGIVAYLASSGDEMERACVWGGLCSGELDREEYVRCMLEHLIASQPFLADPSGGEFAEQLVQQILQESEKYDSMCIIESLMLTLFHLNR